MTIMMLHHVFCPRPLENYFMIHSCHQKSSIWMMKLRDVGTFLVMYNIMKIIATNIIMYL